MVGFVRLLGIGVRTGVKVRLIARDLE